MNNTKWNEIFLTFYQRQTEGQMDVFFRKKLLLQDFDSWENDWEHFGTAFSFWKEIECLQIELCDENRDFVLKALQAIHVPGKVEGNIVTVFGYAQDVEYL